MCDICVSHIYVYDIDICCALVMVLYWGLGSLAFSLFLLGNIEWPIRVLLLVEYRSYIAGLFT